MKFPINNDKRAAETVNRWLPEEGKQLQIPYVIANGHKYKNIIQNSIKKMNEVLHCYQEAWVPRDASKHRFYVKFVLKNG